MWKEATAKARSRGLLISETVTSSRRFGSEARPALTAFQNLTHLVQRPLLSDRQDSHATIIFRNKRVGACRVFNADEFQFRVGQPIQRHVNVAGKDLPLRPVVELDKVTFGM